MTVKEFIGNVVAYDNEGQVLFGVKNKGELQLIADVRGWGAIQNLFQTTEEADAFQDELGNWLADAINEKLKKC